MKKGMGYYNIEEIDRLRKAIVRAYLPDPQDYRSYGDDTIALWTTRVEEMLRTYMMNGTAPEALEALPEHRLLQEARCNGRFG